MKPRTERIEPADRIAAALFLVSILIGLFVFGEAATILAVLYVVPSIIAFRRRHHNMAAIFLLNALLGWTVLGWIAALIWSATAVQPYREIPLRR
jgi:hypothetical protein